MSKLNKRYQRLVGQMHNVMEETRWMIHSRAVNLVMKTDADILFPDAKDVLYKR